MNHALTTDESNDDVIAILDAARSKYDVSYAVRDTRERIEAIQHECYCIAVDSVGAQAAKQQAVSYLDTACLALCARQVSMTAAEAIIAAAQECAMIAVCWSDELQARIWRDVERRLMREQRIGGEQWQRSLDPWAGIQPPPIRSNGSSGSTRRSRQAGARLGSRTLRTLPSPYPHANYKKVQKSSSDPLTPLCARAHTLTMEHTMTDRNDDVRTETICELCALSGIDTPATHYATMTEWAGSTYTGPVGLCDDCDADHPMCAMCDDLSIETPASIVRTDADGDEVHVCVACDEVYDDIVAENAAVLARS